jgi:NTP pyrophosphatase (non-canonical NTP hydrolase)
MVIFTEEYRAFLTSIEESLYGVSTRDRLIWLAAEVGEVMEAHMGMAGTIPRKGFTHTPEDLASELADVAMTALASITTLGLDPEHFMSQNQQKVGGRLNGSSMDQK